MLSSSSVCVCLCYSNAIDLSEILRRITPIDYYPGFLLEENVACPSDKGTLLVDSNQYLFGQLSFLSCDGQSTGTVIDGDGITANSVVGNTIYVGPSLAEINTIGGNLNLPAGSLINGVPIGTSTSYYQIFQLQVCPSNSQLTNLPTSSAGNYIVGGFYQNGYLGYVQYVYYWPCFFDSNAIITYISIYFNVAVNENPPAPNPPNPITASDFVAELRIRKYSTQSEVATGITVTLAGPVSNNTSYFQGKAVTYNVEPGDRAGLYIRWTGNLGASDLYNYTWITYNIGYTPIF